MRNVFFERVRNERGEIRNETLCVQLFEGLNRHLNDIRKIFLREQLEEQVSGASLKNAYNRLRLVFLVKGFDRLVEDVLVVRADCMPEFNFFFRLRPAFAGECGGREYEKSERREKMKR